jgi:glycosyltransferase involved in cell wall biosynthesis
MHPNPDPQTPHRQRARAPAVSIGMPVYNGAKHIHAALDSLLAQSFTDFELTISDNASTDATPAICRDYASRDSRIRYVRQAENRGAQANFEFLLDEAAGAYFMWAAYDDVWQQNYLREATALLRDEGVDFIFPTFRLQSIRLGIRRTPPPDLFRFIESTDRRVRLLQFVAMHHDSHKCNIVYSLFRTAFLKAAHRVQGLDNDGVLGAVILGLGRGRLLAMPCSPNDMLSFGRVP